MTKIGFNLVDLADSATVDTLILLLNTSQKMKRNEEAKIPIDSAKRKLDENELSPRTEDDHQHKKMKLNQDLATTNRSNSSNNVDSIEDKSQDHISIGEENKI
jgi:molecular chaperone DnaK (HSP70)